MTTEILFIGLQEQGASLAMALAQANVDTTHVGYDRDQEARRAIQEAEAVDRVVIDPFKAAETADLVILSLPSDEAEAMLKDIEPRLKSGAAVLDCSHLSASTLRWATENLGPDRQYVGAIPVIRPEVLHELGAGYQGARANLYEGSQLALVVPAETSEAAVNMALNIAKAIGSAPFFLDPAEMEAVTSLIETLPTLLGAALLLTASDSRGWPDIQRVAGRAFAAVTHASAGRRPDRMTERLIDNQHSLVVHLDELTDKLLELRDLVAEGEQEDLEARLREAVEARAGWIEKRERGDWEAEAVDRAEVGSTGLLGNLFGMTDPRRRKDD